MVRTTPANAGIYDTLVRIEINTASTADRYEGGGQKEIWKDSYFEALAAYQAEPSRAGGAEYATDEKRVVEDRALFRLRYDEQTIGIDPATYRLVDVDSGKIWKIERTYDPTGRHIEIHLEVKSVI